ncbi:uncharacterized protein G2W53_031476 [Senna tora]|uniref:Uncharacterized protein n=1 Tax=Senna tora TaxID=362788 RepID=A0A834WCJ1_9FABA|nr:uncharacterized protein G2W53_031476 [Senna tora]
MAKTLRFLRSALRLRAISKPTTAYILRRRPGHYHCLFAALRPALNY